ncbi:MAG: hypothetical protein RLZZ232_3107 [Planctomycetota bacterium]|jgi:pilus assembly protein TadC
MESQVPEHLSISLSSILYGFLVAWLGADAVGFFSPSINERSIPLSARERRNEQLKNPLFALFEPLAIALTGLNLRFRSEVCKRFVQFEADLEPFSPSEFLAICQLRGCVAGTVTAAVAPALLGTSTLSSIVIGVIVLILTSRYFANRELKRARTEQQLVRARLPFAVEMMALLMESGGVDILEALRTAASENSGHPIARKFQKLLIAENRGANLAEALRAWSGDSADEDIQEFALALRTSIERGTPLQSTLRSLAGQFLQRRLQRLERAAEETRVHITWPGMLVVLSCLMIVAAPFILAARDILGW